jgi:hypothetical protein
VLAQFGGRSFDDLPTDEGRKALDIERPSPCDGANKIKKRNAQFFPGRF